MNKIKLLVLDVDGTLTDGKIYMGADGEMMKAFNIKDGYGIHDILPKLGIIPAIITGRTSDIVKKRCQELEIKWLYQGVRQKLDKLCELLSILSEQEHTQYSLANVAYCGDDCNDLSCMTAVKNAGGIVGCPNDAVQEVLEIADFVSRYNGGDGAVRDFIDWLRLRF
ncbi:MAG: KdsC family phosphatase [Acutalibacteraceae bacterium]